MENFANKVRDKLPMLLRDIVDKSVSAEDADMLLVGAMATISATLPNVYGVYDRRKVYPNLYFFVSAEASVGKGRLALCKELVKPIHRELRTQYLVEVDLALFFCIRVRNCIIDVGITHITSIVVEDG